MGGRARECDAEEGARAAKKTRYAPAKGSILKIHVHNFMTYGDAEIIPGPRLNLVLGPNGTGKSSLVNAICLGLAGSTQLLGRADNVRDFVRRGEDEGYVQIWLSTGIPDQAVVIKRSLKARQNASEWRINGAPVNLKDVKEKVKELHVQLDNLCQFLPQDKVVEFAKLRPVELLLETEKAVGDSSLYDIHQNLIKDRNQLKVLENAHKASKEELAVLEKTNESLKRDVDKFEQKLELERQVKALEDKLVWTRYQDLKKRHEENVAEYKLNVERLVAMQARQEDQSRPKEEKQTRRTAAAGEAQKSLQKLRKLEDDMGNVKEELDRLNEEVDDEHRNLDQLDSEYTSWQSDIAKTKTDIEAIREHLVKLQKQQTKVNESDILGQMKQLQVQKRDAMSTLTGLQSTADEVKGEQVALQQEILQSHEQLRRLTDSKVQRLRQLEFSNRGITNLSNWLDTPEAKSLFKGRVYGPILCEVAVDNAQHAAFLEQHCPRDLWSRFVTEHQEDQDLLGRESHKRFRFRPTVTHYTGNVNEVIQHRLGEALQFASYGITSTLDEVFQAPHTVKLVMCNEANLNETFCGSGSTNAEDFLNTNPSIQRLLTPESVYMVRTSRYNANARSLAVIPLRRANLLAVGPDKNVDQERADIQGRLKALTQRRDTIQTRLETLHKDVKDEERRCEKIEGELKSLSKAATAVKQNVGKLQASLKSKEKQLQKAEEKPDPRKKAPKLKKKIESLCQKISTLIGNLTKHCQQLVTLHQIQTSKEAQSRELTSQIIFLERGQQEQIKQLRNLETLMAKMQASIETEKEELRKFKRVAEDRTGPMTDEITTKFAHLPDTVDGIQAAIGLRTADIEAIQLANPRAVHEFNKRKQEIKKLTTVCENQEIDVQSRKASLKEEMGRWLPELRKIVVEINKNFGRSFERIGCAGEVSLHEEKHPDTQQDDFEKFAIHIKVRFRSEEGLQLLTAHRQSGGERSVSTILYLIAIQNVTLCPFRVVDEINQGMDPINERKVFMELVEAACKPQTPQCFLLTPKLLPNLPFSEHVTLLEIYNGASIRDVAAGFKPAHVLGQRSAVLAS